MGPSLLLALAIAGGSCSSGSQRPPPTDGSTGDDGNTAQCGNGILEAGEECDDGNLLPGDECSPTCQVEQCDPTTCFTGCCDASGACVGGVADGACGTGGTSCSDCAASGDVCYQQGCVNGDCTPGETMDCGFCGERTCQPDGTYGPCDSPGECLPDDIDIVDTCGNCGQLVRICDATCTFGPETCTGEGVCAAGTIETGGECGTCGQNERVCNAQCLWDPYQCVGEGSCPGGGECCAGACRDTDTDPDFCGSCTNACGAGEDCCTGDCADTDTDPLHCGGCGSPCNASEQCCTGGCDPYECITGGLHPFIGQLDTWPTPQPCAGGRFEVGHLYQIHWEHRRIYTICVDGATSGTVTACTGEPGVCTPATCPSPMASVGVYVDRSGYPTEQQRICVGPAVSGSGSMPECTVAIGDTCVPPPCTGSGNVDIGEVREITPPNITFIRLCITPICPPPCP